MLYFTQKNKEAIHTEALLLVLLIKCIRGAALPFEPLA